MTTVDYWHTLSFAYLTTYSYNRGPLNKRMMEAQGYQQTFIECDHLEGWNCLFQPDGTMNPTTVVKKTYAFDSPQVAELANIFLTPLVDKPHAFMCSPVYRDSICFFAEDGRMVSHVDMCLGCDSVLLEGKKELNRDRSFYEAIRAFFKRAGHDIDQGWDSMEYTSTRLLRKPVHITVQQAVAEGDRDLAFRVRELVFVEEQHVPREEEYDEYDDAAHQYLAWADGMPVGTARWRPTEKGVKLERFAVLAPYRSKGVGGVLLRQVMADARAAHPEADLYLHAQVQAQLFYQRHGFVPEGELFYECDIPHYRMRLSSRPAAAVVR